MYWPELIPLYCPYARLQGTWGLDLFVNIALGLWISKLANKYQTVTSSIESFTLISSKMKINALWGSYDLLSVHLSSWVKFIRAGLEIWPRHQKKKENTEENKKLLYNCRCSFELVSQSVGVLHAHCTLKFSKSDPFDIIPEYVWMQKISVQVNWLSCRGALTLLVCLINRKYFSVEVYMPTLAMRSSVQSIMQCHKHSFQGLSCTFLHNWNDRH